MTSRQILTHTACLLHGFAWAVEPFSALMLAGVTILAFIGWDIREQLKTNDGA